MKMPVPMPPYSREVLASVAGLNPVARPALRIAEELERQGGNPHELVRTFYRADTEVFPLIPMPEVVPVNFADGRKHRDLIVIKKPLDIYWTAYFDPWLHSRRRWKLTVRATRNDDGRLSITSVLMEHESDADNR